MVSDQFVSLAKALLLTPRSRGRLATPPAIVIVPYPVSGIDRDAVIAKGRAVAPETARELARKLAESSGDAG